MNLKNKQEIVKTYGKNEKDTGSTAVQVAMMSQKISELTEHLKSNQKENTKWNTEKKEKEHTDYGFLYANKGPHGKGLCKKT